ncbi:MAG: hypothetical protein FWD19_00120, partial [Defluviitaleaceae bacterium]|nr:hypothetical protein [Defluviitaleaceae bacterium]
GGFNSHQDEYGTIFCLQSYLSTLNMPHTFAETARPISPTHATSQITVTARQGEGFRFLDVNRIVADNRTRGVRLSMEFRTGDVIRVEGRLNGTSQMNFRFQPDNSPSTEIRDNSVTVLPGGRFVLTHTIAASDNGGTAITGMRIVTEAVGATSYAIESWTVYRPDPTVRPDNYLFHLQSYIANMNLGSIGTGTTHLAPTHEPANVTVSIREGSSPGTRQLFVNRTQANSTRGLLLRGLDLEEGDVLNVSGRILTGSSSLSMRLQMTNETGYMPGNVTGSGVGAFSISYTISERYMNRAPQGIRIIPHGSDVVASFQVDNLTVYRPSIPEMPTVLMPNSAMRDSYKISNPYQTVNWNTWFQFRAAHHVHTTRSDGGATLRDMVVDHYNRGFDIFSANDHNVICTGDWTRHPPAAPTVYWWQPMDWNNNNHLMSAADQTAIRNGTWAPGSGRTLPTGSRFTTANGWIRPQMRTRLGMPAGQSNVGMISIPNTNEQTIGHHMNTYWANFNGREHESDSTIIREVQRLGGLVILNHPGRHTCMRSGSDRCSTSREGLMCDHAGGRGHAAASNLPREVSRYTSWLNSFPAIIGMEIYNRSDHETRSDRILWDNVLLDQIPRGRNVWGFSNDDSHSMDGTALGWNVMLMPSLTDGNLRTSMEGGAFYFVSRVDRQLGVNHNVSTSGGSAWHVPLMTARAPSITRISVTGQTISVTGRNYDEIIWVTGNPFRANGNASEGGGVIIATGDTIDLSQVGKFVWGNYVRAVLICRTGIGNQINSHGVALTQPFAIFNCDACDGTVACSECGSTGNADQQAVNSAAVALTWESISNGQDMNEVTGNLRSPLPVSAAGGVTISWLSNNSAISNAGVVTRPATTNATGTFVATLRLRDATATRTFNPVVTARTPTLTFNPTSTTINNTNLTRNISVGGTATGNISVTNNIPVAMQQNIFVDWTPTSSTITVRAVRPSTDVAPLSGNFNVSVTRQNVTQSFSVSVENLSTTAPNLATLSAPNATVTLASAVTNAAGAIALLPATAAITTTPTSTQSPLAITWTPPANFNSAAGATNSFAWAVTLPNTIRNTNSIALNGTTVVTNFTPTATLTLSLTTTTITNQNLTRTITVGGTATGNISVTNNISAAMQNYISVEWSPTSSTITIRATRPNIDIAALNGSFNVTVTRQGIERSCAVTVTNLTTTAPNLASLTSPGATRTLTSAVTNAAGAISQLPATAAITTTPTSTQSPLAITWTPPANFNSAAGATNSFAWAVTLPNTIRNTNSIALNGTTVVTNFTPSSSTVTFTSVPANRNISDTNLTVTTTVGGTATGNISVTNNIPAAMQEYISVEWSANSATIRVRATRPFRNVAPVTGSFNVSVTRQGVTQSFAINVNLTTTWTPLLHPIGDTTGKGQITSADMIIIARYLAGHFTGIPGHFTQAEGWPRVADTKCAGEVNPESITHLLKFLTGSITTLCPHGGCWRCQG